IAENLDAHRKRQQALHPELTLTGMYNVLEALREGRVLNEKEQILHQWALTSVLKELHDSLDDAVAAAYGWPADLDDESILERLVALNGERAREESNGTVRYLRPDFQNPAGGGGQAGLGLEPADEAPLPKNAEKVPWPGSLPQQVAALRTRLAQSGESTVEQLGAAFQKAPKKDLLGILELLCSLGMAVALPGKRWCEAGR
ncbi:MAG TPA: class I SAM-dependent DNA methyltransferase, partial [Myxococcota bacterium]|nr:class I SAM-dependent DNA methyltransferase [Myxococcota bacterium]